MDRLEAKGAKETRAVRREPYGRSVDLILVPRKENGVVPAYTRNLSACGLGLLCRRAIAVGNRFVVLLPIGGPFGKFLLCRVIFCRYVSDGVHEIGTEFEMSHAKFTAAATYPAAWNTPSVRSKQPA